MLAAPHLPGAVEIHAAVALRKLRAEAVLLGTLNRIAQAEPVLKAWQLVDREGALAAAQALDRRLDGGGSAGLLAGVPLAIKDNLDVRGLPTGCGSRVPVKGPALADAAVVALARAADALPIGKTALTEFAYFQPGPTTNPWHAGHTPGGSSSGSAAAVAAGLVPLAFGTQTAGSVTRPAAYCGVFGFKPAHDAALMLGARPFATSLDTVGWFARSAADLELMRAALAGEPWQPLLPPAPPTLRLLCWDGAAWEHLNADGRTAWATAFERLSAAGVAIEPVTPPAAVVAAHDAQKLVMGYEGAHAFDAERLAHLPLLSDTLCRFIEQGRAIDVATRDRALADAAAARQPAMAWLGQADALLMPAATGAAPQGLGATGDPVFARAWTLLGLPTVAVPGLRNAAGLPIGLQLVGRIGAERALLETAAAVFRVLAPEDEATAGAVRPAALTGGG